MRATVSIESVIRRERVIVGGALAVVAGLAWVELVRMAMSGMGSPAMAGMAPHGGMTGMHPRGATEVAMLFVMWAVMMVAMMLPSAAPMILMFAGVNRRRAEQGRAVVSAGVFVLGYLVVWTAYAALAASAQSALHAAALLSPAMVSASPFLAGALLVAAGIFQWTPLKRACLAACRSPLAFLMTCWREGHVGAFVMGLRHGAYCVGCCWILMALLFVAGVMNLVWVAAIAAFVLAEKVLPGGELVGRVAGVGLAAAGLGLLLHGAFA